MSDETPESGSPGPETPVPAPPESETPAPESATPESETPAPETPVPETAAAEEPTQPVATPQPGPAAGAVPAERRGVFVPRWLAILIGLVVAVGLVGGGGFWLGRETADDDGREHSERSFEPGEVPSLPRVPDGPGIPDAPQAPQGRQLLGVAVEQADNGAAIARVASGSPADDAGLEVGDVITEVDGEAVSGPADLVSVIRSYEDGDEIEITYERDGETTTVQVTLAELSSDDGSAS